jgi:hypothetical protein
MHYMYIGPEITLTSQYGLSDSASAQVGTVFMTCPCQTNIVHSLESPDSVPLSEDNIVQVLMNVSIATGSPVSLKACLRA